MDWPSASARAKDERNTLLNVRVVFAGFPNLSVCRLTMETWVCLRALLLLLFRVFNRQYS